MPGVWRLAGSIIFCLVAAPREIDRVSAQSAGTIGPLGLWHLGDLPIVLVRIRDHARLDLVRQAVQAHAYWRLKGVSVDLVI